jgi:hypothetical protein
MRTGVLKLAIAAVMCFSAASYAPAQQAEAPLTNAAVVKLVRAGFKEKTVIAIIHSRPNHFNLDPDKLIELKHSGVSENIILAMLELGEPILANDDWTDDSTFGSGNSRAGDPKAGGQSGSTDIFGNSSGSSSKNSGRGMSGANEGDTTATGSATVRILRPPAEAGGAPLKLEKTPTLTNESVVKLVDAGFSEGTIIKRIEDSPAAFDLSNDKLEELRRRRVTEPIIMAMTAAMGDDSGARQSGSGSGPTRKGN